MWADASWLRRDDGSHCPDGRRRCQRNGCASALPGAATLTLRRRPTAVEPSLSAVAITPAKGAGVANRITEGRPLCSRQGRRPAQARATPGRAGISPSSASPRARAGRPGIRAALPAVGSATAASERSSRIQPLLPGTSTRGRARLRPGVAAWPGRTCAPRPSVVVPPVPSGSAVRIQPRRSGFVSSRAAVPTSGPSITEVTVPARC